MLGCHWAPNRRGRLRAEGQPPRQKRGCLRSGRRTRFGVAVEQLPGAAAQEEGLKMRRFRVFVFPVVAISLSIAILVAVAGPASARRAGVSTTTKAGMNHSSNVHEGSNVAVSKYGLSCTKLTGSITFNPPLSETLTKKEKANVAGALSGCSAVPTQGGSPVTVTKGTVSGTITFKRKGGEVDCSELLAGLGTNNDTLSGKLVAYWASSPALSPSTTKISVKSAANAGSGNSDEIAGQLYAIPGPLSSTISGAFTGASKQGSLLAIVPGLTLDQEAPACLPSNDGGHPLTTLPIASGLLDSWCSPDVHHSEP